MNWISIHSKLPDEYDYVLLSFIDKNNPRFRFEPSVGYLRQNVWHTKEGDIECSDRSYDFMREHHFTVTHWAVISDPS